MRHREPWQELIHAAQCGRLHPQVLIVLSIPMTTIEQAAQMMPLAALFGLASGTVPFHSVWQSHVTGPSETPKCHVSHGNF